MAQSVKSKKILNMVYGLGASVVLIGALFKILHYQIGPLTGGVMLTVGLLTEAFIFAYSAFFEPIDEDLDWTQVYPELAGGIGKEKKKESNAKGLLSEKLDEMLRQSNLDAELVGSLAKSIKNFKGAAESINSSVDTVANTHKYNEEMAVAAVHLESLNSLYRIQAESSERQSFINESMLKHSEKLESQMEVLANNLSSLNSVYGGMLSAMNK
ncbi:gliding motility protein GldL [Flavicella sp.]|uniref:type IX secretion system motor protein PorL/GldL n=1 Tax=Flavicella sp. TaxID=2957742 RepID=UPI003019AFC7